MANGLASSVATQRTIYDVICRYKTGAASLEEVMDITGKSRATVGPVLKWLMSEGSVEKVVWRDGSCGYRRIAPYPLSDAERLERYEEDRRRIRELIEGDKSKLAKQIMEILK
jgi:hypothetical protein